jgi:plastocyanin
MMRTLFPETPSAVILSSSVAAVTAQQYTPVKAAKIIIKDYAYSPATLKVRQGTKVIWTNKDSARHTLTTGTPHFNGGVLRQGKSYSHTFNQKGDYDYYCSLHPYMVGKVIVE